MISVETLRHALGGEISRGTNGPQVLCPGPGHSAADRSLAVSPAANEDGFIVHSFSSDDPIVCKDYVRDRMGLPPFKPGNGHGNGHTQQRTIAKTSDYTDETGQLLFQAVRYVPKGFAQRRPDGSNGWTWKLDGVRRVPYRLPELIEALANDRPVFVVEGEKDAEALWSIGVPATCNPQGAGKWHDEYSAHFKDATVYIIPDDDKAGTDHADQVVASLTKAGATAKVVQLPGLPKGGDVSDWIKSGGTADQLYTLASAEPASGLKEWDAGDDLTPPPPRGWLLGNIFCRMFMSSLLADGGVGKTALRYAQLLSLATGRSLTGEHVFQRCRVLIISLEDDCNELKRRILAACLHHNIKASDLKGWLFLSAPGAAGGKLMTVDKAGRLSPAN